MELKEIQRLEGHTDRVWSLDWNPATGHAGIPLVFASCSGDKTVRIWEQNLSSGLWACKAVLDETHTRTVRSCAWSPSGKLLATGSFDATTAIWENVGGDFECVSTLEGHENEVKSVCWNASGTLLATCSRDKSVWIWEVLPGNEFECVSVLQGHAQDVKMVKWHPTEDILFSCSYDNNIKVWADEGDSDDWQCVQTLGEPNKYYFLFCLITSNFTASLFSSLCSNECFVCLLCKMYCAYMMIILQTNVIVNFNLIHLFITLLFVSGHTSTVWALSFNASGDKMVSCSDDLTVKVWGTENIGIQSGGGFAPWRHLCTLTGYHDRTIFSVHWSREGIFASGAADDAIRLFVDDNESQVCLLFTIVLLLLRDRSLKSKSLKNSNYYKIVGGPLYKLLLKKEKAHDMDVNFVQWSPGVRFLDATLIESH
ncbi:hypothetical protein ACSQ67_001702 [Phaseolus vulgaris]